MKVLSLIIVTYNSTKHIIDCLESIYKHNDIGDGLEVIVVDNASPEQKEMFSVINRSFKNKVVLVDSGRNGGYGFGNNIGVQYSSADNVIVMNPDVRLVQPIFSKIIGILHDKSIGLLGVDFVDGSCPFYYKRGYASVLRNLFPQFYIWRGNYNSKEMYLSGSFLAFNKNAFLKAGGFDENIFMYSEEADLTNRLLLQGFKVIWCKELKVQHLAHGRSFNPYLNKIRMESGLYYERKYNVDSVQVYRSSTRATKIKLMIARFLGKKEKSKLFQLSLEAEEKFFLENVKNNNFSN